MHFERLAIEAGDDTFTLDFHERLTVIAGMGQLERDGLVNELVGGLSAGRPGVHLEVRSDGGERYAVFRPRSGAPRIVDIERAADVTASFTNGAGQVNILERAGLTPSTARRAMRITAADLAARSHGDALVDRLARLDPDRLWDVARGVLESKARLEEIAEALGSNAEDVEAYDEIERRHAELETVQREAESIRGLSFAIAALCTMAALPAMLVTGPWLTVPLLAGAIAAVAYSLVAWRRSTEAERREQEALDAVGARSYLAFQVSRVNELVASETQRRQLMAAASDHRKALTRWEVLAGDVPADWALEHRREIAEAHAALRRALGVTGAMPLTVDADAGESGASETQAAVRQHLGRLRHLGAGGESFPAFLDDPFVELDPAQKVELLGVAAQASRQQQIVVLTDDPAVVHWARLECISGDLALVEPAGRSRADETSASKRSRHVAA